MQTFRYIKGTANKDARGYVLAKKTNNTYAEVARRFKSATLYINGGILPLDGSLERSATTFPKEGIKLNPLTETTEDGYVYYVKVNGLMRVKAKIDNGDEFNEALPDIFNDVRFEGKVYFDTPAEQTIKYTESLSIDKSAIRQGIYLNVTVGSTNKTVLVYKTDTTNIEEASVTAIQVVYANTINKRSDFIPFSVLTDELTNVSGGACFGVFTNEDATGALKNMAKVSFYKGVSHSSFIGGYTGSQIANFFRKEAKQYLTVDEIRQLAQAIITDGELKDAEGNPLAVDNLFVIFCSSQDVTIPNTNVDLVSIGGIFFPLWDKRYDVADGDSLCVKCLGDGKFFSDSDYSDTVTYTTVS